MKLFKTLTIIILAICIQSCGNDKSEKKKQFSITTNTTNGTIKRNETLKLEIKNPKKHNITSVEYLLDDKKIEASTQLLAFKLGKQNLTATINYDNDSETVEQNITILNDVAPKLLKFEIVNTYPHDNTSYTQGLEFYNDTLYESTGQYTQSKLIKVNYKTGEVLKNINLDNAYFAEGITILNDKIYQLTWQNKKGLVYNLNTLERESSFSYGKSVEGWGLCNDGENLLKSDGTSKIWTLDASTLTETSYIQAYTNKGKIGRLNELEYINGKIYSNIYHQNGVAIINPKNGATEAVIDFTPLTKKISNYSKDDNVLNGIAYNKKTNTIFVTGKRWDTLFEVKVVE